MSRERVSACLIVQNERDRLPAALESVAFCDEVIVVDGGSTDDTAEIARAHGAQVIENPWPGFARQRNLAIDNASGAWVLEVDADERISPRLRVSIESMLASPPNGAAIAIFPLRNVFLGRTLGPSAKYPAYRARLFRRGAYRHDEFRSVHEGIQARARPLVLEGDLEHELAATIGEALADLWSYARLESEHVPAPATAHAYVTGIVLRPTAKLLYRTVVEGGWRDGWRGILKISLDVTSDAIVWVRVLARSRHSPSAGDPARLVSRKPHEHFGRHPKGAARIVAVAARGAPTESAARWLSELQARGVDVALISADAGMHPLTPGQAVRRLGPLTLIRALELEMSLRVIDAVVPVGSRARLIHRLLPPTLRPSIDGLDVALGPERAVTLVREAITDR